MDIYVLVIVVSMMVLSALIYWGEQRSKKRIQKYLEEKGYKGIIVKGINQLGRHHSRVYEVQYYDQDHVFHRNSCVTDTSTFTEKIISWKEPLN
jgi:hypothetical protein